MRVPWSWLCEYCDPQMTPDELAERLSMTGTEVERISHAGAPSPRGFVVGRVLSAEPHPGADRLRVCEVDTGDGQRTIVCGAPNVAAGQLVCVALPGTVLPGGRELAEASLRGVTSEGMILSERELAIGDDHSGILVLGTDGELTGGTPLEEVFAVSEPVLELEVTPNRPDCLGIYGVAREVHAVTGRPLAPPPWERDAEALGEGGVSELASVTVEAPELCPRFTARAFTGVEIGPSPVWMKARLAAAGQRPISSVVDVTNYAMLLTAQPLHAFDLDAVRGGELIVRRAGEGERMTTLDGVERSFDSDAVLVCDREGPSGVAGIMGGQVSEVSGSTSRVLMEAATWNPTNILRTSSRLGLRSEASTRFEKGLHPELAMRAQRVSSRLLVELGATLVPGTIDVAAQAPPPRVVSLRGTRVEELLGMAIDPTAQEDYLERLGFGVQREGQDMQVTVPPDRHRDVDREADLIEEVARIHGLDEHLPRTLPAVNQAGALTREQGLRRRAEDLLRDLGLSETVSWSFVAPQLADRLRLPACDPRRDCVAVHNPLSEEQSVMRTTLLGGLLDAARHNLARDAERVALFESGRAYLRAVPRRDGPLAGSFAGTGPAPVREPHRLAGLLIGGVRPPGWRGGAPQPDLFDGKGVLEALAAGLGASLELAPSSEPFLHPGRSAAVLAGGEACGWLGEMHPLVAREWDLPGGIAFEIDLAPLLAHAGAGRELYEDLITFPAVYQDLAIVAPSEVPAAEVRGAVLAGGGELLRSARIFDVYEGEQVGAGKRSLALRLEFRAPDRTLTDEEVAARREAIAVALEPIGGSLRE